MPSEHHWSSWLCSKCLTIDRDQNHPQWWHQYPQWSSVWINSDNYQSSNGWLSSFYRYWCRRKKTAVKGIASPGKYDNNRRLSWFTRFIIIFITDISIYSGMTKPETHSQPIIPPLLKMHWVRFLMLIHTLCKIFIGKTTCASQRVYHRCSNIV